MDAFVTVYNPICGWKAVLMTWEVELDCHTPEMTSPYAYETKEEAIVYGREWAKAEGVEFKE